MSTFTEDSSCHLGDFVSFGSKRLVCVPPTFRLDLDRISAEGLGWTKGSRKTWTVDADGHRYVGCKTRLLRNGMVRFTTQERVTA